MPRKNEPTERQCIVDRQTKPVSKLIRFALDGDKNVVPDLKQTLPGRGVWVTANASAIDIACQKGLFARGFGGAAHTEQQFSSRVDALLEASALGSLGFVMKSGQLITGFAKVISALGSVPCLGLIEATDGATDGIRKIASKIEQEGLSDRLKRVRIFSSTQLESILGKETVVHCALLQGSASVAFIQKVIRLENYRRETEFVDVK